MLMEDWTERTIVKEGLIRAAKGGWINLMKKYKDLLLIFATNACSIHYRVGQALMNALADVDRELYVNMTGTDIDCFYEDHKIPEAMQYIIEQFDKES